MDYKITFSTIALFLVFSALAQPKTQQAQPNILLFIADDCTHRDLGCYGSQDAKTPNIDKFAEEGIKFNRCFQAVAMCSPTRSNLYTGIYPVKSGAYPNHTFVKKGTQSIVQYLAPKGYRTALLGKTHISPKTEFPFEYLGDPGDDLDFPKMDQFLADVSKNEQPFCLFVCSHQPHSPHTKGNPDDFDPKKLTLPPYWVDTKETRSNFSKILAEINYLDGEFGTALDLLKKYGFTENTVVVFTSEQGNALPYSKWTCYGNGLQTAFLVRWPEVIKPGSVSNAMIEYVDVTPTFLDIAGLKIPEKLDGESFLPVLLGKADTHKKYVYGIQTSRGVNGVKDYYGSRTIRSEKFRYIMNLTPEMTVDVPAAKGKIIESWKVKGEKDPAAAKLANNYIKRPAEELYDVIIDPFELNNLAADPKYATVKNELKTKLQTWMKQQGDKGQKTELQAYEHQVESRLKKVGDGNSED